MKNLLYIGNKLSLHGYTPTVIETLGPSLEKEGFELIYASDKKNKLIRLLDMMYKTIRYRRRADYVLIDTYSTSNFYYAWVISQLCRVFGKRYIPILHGGNLPQRLIRSSFLCDLIFNHAYRNVAPSDYLKSAFENRGYKNMIYIPNSINIQEYPFDQRVSVVPKLLWVRSFAGIYNPKMAIRIVSLLQKDYPSAMLYMVGPDKENLVEDCKSYAKSLEANVQFTGKLSGAEWRKLSKECSIFINTPHFDNTPVSVIEAMALGLPIVSTNVGGLPYLLKDKENALLVADNDVESMGKAIKRLLASEELTISLTQKSRKIIESFDWESVKFQWLEILK